MARSLVIETAAAACSVALIDDGALIAQQHVEVGRGHAERLVPMIADLPDGGRADAILVDCGPGSFTGIRVGIAAARGLALGWAVPARGFSALPLVAAAALAADPALAQIAVALEGGHGELFVAAYDRALVELVPLASRKPDAALALIGDRVVAGNGVHHLAAIAGGLDLRPMLPRAADARLLPPQLTALPPRPIYGRAPDAKPIAA